MRNRIFGGIGVLWGGAIIIWTLLGNGNDSDGSAYAAGAGGALLFAVVMLVTGGYFLRKG